MSSNAVALFATMLAAPAPTTNDAIMTTYVELTSVEPRCRQSVASDEVIVCARRDADRYRLPFVATTPGDPHVQDVPAERLALIPQQSPCDRMGPFLVGCGMIGISVGAGLGSNGRIEWRPLAP